MIDNEIYSFSRFMTFKSCPYSYYLTYVKQFPRKDNIYSFLGTVIHELLEKLQKNEILKEDAIKIFSEKFYDAEILGFNFPTENSKKKFYDCVIKYLLNYKRFENVDYYIEEYFETNIEDIKIRGYIDVYTITDNKYIDIYDYKSSSKFSKKDLEEKRMQLIIYAIALQEKYPDLKIRSLNFDMIKYSKNEKDVLVERNKAENQEKRGFIEIEFNDENIKQTKKFIKNITKEINRCDKNIEFDWEAKVNKFFCKNLCSNYSKCERSK